MRSLSWSSDGKTLAAAVKGRKVLLWEASSGKVLAPVETPDDEGRAVAWSPNGKLLACGGDKATIIWDAVAGKIVHTIPYSIPERPLWSPWAPDNHRLVFPVNTGHVMVWDLATDKMSREWLAHSWVHPCRRLVTGWQAHCLDRQ